MCLLVKTKAMTVGIFCSIKTIYRIEYDDEKIKPQ